MKKTLAGVLVFLMPLMMAAQNVVRVLPESQPITFNPMIFGQFIEHFDNQIYGGIFDPGNPLSDEDGFRTDVIDALKEIKTPIVRWPGGCFVSTYHWLDGVGPERQPVYDKTWQVEDPNTFGTDEYIKWCRKVGCEPYICTNAGTGTPEEMSDWVEYCNLTVGKWARLRMKNGHHEPYNVKYWSVGNENWGAHELGARTVQEWGPLVRESAKLMCSVTKDAKLFAAATSDMVDIACFSPIVNTRGAIFVDKQGIVKRTTFYVLWMYTNLLEKNILPVESNYEPLKHNNRETGVLDIVLTTDDSNKRYVYAIVNKDPDNDVELNLDLSFLNNVPNKVEAKVLSGETPDDYNDRGRENVVPKDLSLTIHNGKVKIPAHSLTFIMLNK